MNSDGQARALLRCAPGVFIAVAWMLFTAWCVHGYPPSVDLPVHGAQMESLARLIRSDPTISSVYRAHLRPGYGIWEWLLLPLALLASGATAARVGMWMALLLFPLGTLALLRAWQRPAWLAVLAMPLSFNAVYAYGFLSFHTS